MESLGRYEDMAYGAIGKEVLGVLPYTEADPIGVHAAILALFSAALNGRVTQPGGRPVVVWTCLAGRSSIGCKGTALEAAQWVLKPALEDFLNIHLRSGLSSGPSLINALHEQHQDSLTSDNGPDGRLVIVEEEWQSQLRRTNRCPTFSGVFRTAWDGKVVINTTKGKGGEREEQRVDNPQLGFHSHIQPGAWSKYISATEALGGSYNRILPVMVERSKFLPSPEEGQPRAVYTYAPTPALKLAYNWARKETRVMTLSSAARKRFDELRMTYEEQNAELPEVLASFFERAAEQVWRVAAVLTAANRKTVIPREAVEAARHFVDYSIASVTQLVNQSSDQRRNLPLDERIRKHLKAAEERGEELTLTRLYRVLGSGRFTAAQIESEAKAMPDVELETVKDTGRPGSKPTIVRLVTGPQVGEVEAPQAWEPASVPQAGEAEQILTAYAEWASRKGNEGKTFAEFVVQVTQQATPPARKAPAKRTAAKPKGTAAASSSAPRRRGTATRKAATSAQQPAEPPVKKSAGRSRAKSSTAAASA